MTGLLPVIALGLLLTGLAVVRWPVLIPIGFGLIAPAGLLYLPGGVQLITLAALAVIALALFERLWEGVIPVPSSVASWSAVIWTLGIVISVAHAADPGRAAIFGTWQTIAVWLAISFASTVGRPDRVGAILFAWLLGGLAVGLSGLLLHGAGLEAAYGGSVISGRAVGVFSQPNEYGTYCMLLLVFSAGIVILTRGPCQFLAMVTGSTCLAGLVVSFSRGAWVGAVAGSVLLVVLAPQARRPQALALMAGGMAFAAVLVLLPSWSLPRLLVERVLTIFQPDANPYDDRPVLRAEGLRQFAERPVFGQGPNMYSPLSTGSSSPARTVEGVEHPHNFMLTIAAEQGIMGLIGLLGLVLTVLFACMQAGRELRSALRTKGAVGIPAHIGAALCVSAGAATGALLVEGLADFPMRNALMRTTVWTVFGWAFAGWALMRSRPPDMTTNRWGSEPVRVNAPGRKGGHA